MAIQNAIGGMVHESVKALATHKCGITEEFEFLVSHCLMVYPGVKKTTIKTIMSHPQALAQYHRTLDYKYPDLKQISGKGKLIDQAVVAKDLSAGKMDKKIAVLAPAICAKLYNLEIIDERLQDMKMNFTTFFWLKVS